jgi:hypothetical protein
MKIFSPVRLFTLAAICLCNSVHSQNAYITSMISETNLDSLILRSEQISGATEVTVGGVNDTIRSRHRSKAGNELAYRFIMEKFSSYGLQIDSLTFGTNGGKNALAIQPGTLYPDQYFIICAHYDAMPNANYAPAADDDGSGVAAVLEAARILKNYAFEYTIVFAIWDEEEFGLAGSTAYATWAQSDTDSLLGVLNMDAIAWDSDNDDVARLHTRPIANSLSLASTVNTVNTLYNIGIDLIMVNPGATYSDHAAFWNKGFSAVLLIEDWDNDSNPHYHTATDKVIYFNQPYFHKMVRLAIASIATMAVPVGFTGINDQVSAPGVTMYPNPSQGIVTIELNGLGNHCQIRIMDMYGRVVLVADQNSSQLITLDTGDLASGCYFVKIIAGDTIITRKLIRK